MEQHQSPLRGGRQLTPQQFDFYVQRARAERSKAIAEFGGSLIRWLASLVQRRRARPGDGTRAQTAGHTDTAAS